MKGCGATKGEEPNGEAKGDGVNILVIIVS